MYSAVFLYILCIPLSFISPVVRLYSSVLYILVIYNLYSFISFSFCFYPADPKGTMSYRTEAENFRPSVRRNKRTYDGMNERPSRPPGLQPPRALEPQGPRPPSSTDPLPRPQPPCKCRWHTQIQMAHTNTEGKVEMEKVICE